MKILWVVNHYMVDLAEKLGKNQPVSGSWLVEISKYLSNQKDIELNVIIAADKSSEKIVINNINYYLLKTSKFNKFIYPTLIYEKSVNKLIEEIKPDIIHLQGSEFAYGISYLKEIRIPVIISIQGLISEISKSEYSRAGISNKNLLKYFNLNNILIDIPESLKNLRNKFRSKAEKKQLSMCNFIVGRTLWDNAHSYFYNKNRKYYHLQEIMREEFYKKCWDIKNCNKNTILCAGGYSSPIKGAHKVIEAVSLLKDEFPNIELRIVGDDIFSNKPKYGYKKYIHDIIFKLDMNKNIKFIGRLNAEEMAEELQKANVYVMGSSIENSSNTMGEAMIVGTPSIVSYVGGIPSLAKDEIEVLFYRFGDVQQMAWQIRRILMDNNFALNLSNSARKRAKNQYQSQKIGCQMELIYEDILKEFQNINI